MTDDEDDDAFFTASQMMAVRPPAPMAPMCGACKLNLSGCLNPKMPRDGRGESRVLIIAEAPGRDEDIQNRPLVGETGQLLERTLRGLRVDMRRDCWLYNAVICFTGDVRIETPSPVQIGYRRRYEGELIRLRTSGGRVLTGTPNHPILTENGWVALGLLKEGDHLICRTSRQGVSVGDSEINNPPPAFEELFESLCEFGDVKRVVGSSVDFHGDGEDCDVDVVGADGLLRDGIESTVDEQLNQVGFVPTDAGAVSLLRYGTREGNSFHEVGRSFLPGRGIVSRSSDGSSPILAELLHSDPHGIRSCAERNTKAIKNQIEPLGGDAERIRQRLQSLPGGVTTDRVVHVERKVCYESFDGDDATVGPTHVYNLQTEDGYYLANGIVVSNCRPPDNKLANHKRAIEYCRPNVLRTVRELKPEVIILLGTAAVQSLISHLWKADPGGIMRWAGWRIPSIELDAWVCPTFHPSFVSREQSPVVSGLFARHLQAAFDSPGRPWRGSPPDYESQVEVILNADDAAARLRRYRAGIIAFDFESTTLKPDTSETELVTCSVCWEGEETIAFPWMGRAKAALMDLLDNPDVGKIASNAKHEDRWTLRKLGIEIARLSWVWDTMLTAHSLDVRKGITGLKFQSFVRLGAPDYSHHIEPFLIPKKAKGGNAVNRVKDIEIRQLLRYNGLDSLLEFGVAEHQAKEMGVRLA